ncbi:MAG: dephospho-CoA kinase [Ferruginibacter sp.]|nr:dephospho-CoA kinase [Ferruginibacter sp.]
MIKVGITGGMGSGKTTVAKIFEVLGIPVYYADDAAKRLMNEDEDLKEQLQQLFGEEAYLDGILNRKYISGLVFNNDEKLTLLNSIVHPATLRDASQWMLRQNTAYAIKEAALIFESGAQQQLDYVIGVYAPVPVRIQRVMKRDGVTAEEVKARMEKQMDEATKMRLCDYVITNDEQDLVIPQVIKIHETFIAMKR